MPAVSKTQQKLFGIVHAIQTGRANPQKFSKSARRLAQTMSHADVKKYATTAVSNLPNKIAELLQQDINAGAEITKETDGYNLKQTALMAIVKDRKPAMIDGTAVDLYTAALLYKVICSLTGENKHKFLQMPVDKMVATAYKLVTR
jgi:hypothetical protein